MELPPGIEVMHPFKEPLTLSTCKQFYNKFYNDHEKRFMIIGINPGRFGGGITGIPFTDPIRLEVNCGIPNEWQKRQELSSVFIYEMIEAFGGVAAFYRRFYITAVSPLGFTMGNKNLNYYDDKLLQQRIEPFAKQCLLEQFEAGVDRSVAFCLGDGKNYAWLSKFNQKEGLFENIVPLSHPRFIMQYKLKTKQVYIDNYLKAFAEVLK